MHKVYFGRARALMRWVLRVPGVVHQIVRDSEPGVADNKAILTQCIPRSGILPGEEILLSTDIQRNVLCRLFPERQIQSQLLCVRSTVGRAMAVNGWFRVGAVHLQGLRLSRELRAQSVAALRAV